MPSFPFVFTAEESPEETLLFPSFEDVVLPFFKDRKLMDHFHGRNHENLLLLDFGPRPDDPAQLERWEAAHQMGSLLCKRFEPVCRREQRYNRRKARERKLTLLHRNDPLAERTMHILSHVLDGLPPSLRILAERELDTNPHAFMSLYSELREVSEEFEQDHYRTKCRSSTPGSPASPQTNAEQDSTQELTELKRRLRQGLGTDADVLRYFELTANPEALAD